MHLLLEHLQCWWDSRRQPFPLIVAKWHIKCCEHGGHFIQLDIYVAHSLLSGSGTPCTRALVGCTPSHHRGISSNYQICHWLHYRPAIDLSCLVNLPHSSHIHTHTHTHSSCLRYYCVDDLVEVVEEQLAKLKDEHHPICRVPVITSLDEEHLIVSTSSKVCP